MGVFGPEKIDELRTYEASTLRVRWDNLRMKAEAKSGALNWDAVPADAWDRVDAQAYHSMVFKWAIQVQGALQAVDPDGTSSDPGLASLRTTFPFHIQKIVFLEKLGVSLPEVPSDLEAIWKGIKAAFTGGLPGAGPSPLNWILIAALVIAGGVAILVFSRR